MARFWTLLAAVCLVAATCGVGRGQSGWSVSPITIIPGTVYEMPSREPGCEGTVIVDPQVRRYVEGLGRRTPDPEVEPPTRASRAVGDFLNFLGVESVFQDFGNCVEVCAVIPMSARRVTNLVGYAAFGPGAGFTQIPFGRYWSYLRFRWKPDVDTTRFDERGRLVCATALGWLKGEDIRAFLVVGYE
ncbi:MAG: hypothetical protein KF813_12110 [Trueperaceae bacterium]|nr:hypothetical protein [Trueperaceae bacterium]